MAKYSTAIRNSRMSVLQTAVQGGSLKLCSGAVPSSLAVPGAGVMLSEHAIDASAGTVTSGTLSLSDSDVGEDSSANNTGAITYAVVVKSGVAVAQWAVPSEASVSINGGAGQQITQGLPVDVDSLTVIEGNA